MAEIKPTVDVPIEEDVKVKSAKKMAPMPHPEIDWIWVGARTDAHDLDALKRNNIKYILNCTPPRTMGGVPNFHEKDPYFTYKRLVMQDNATERITDHFEDAWDFFEMCRIREDGNILVHCNMGVSRSVSMIAVYLCKYYRYSLDDALAVISSVRPQGNPNDNFRNQLTAFHDELTKKKNYAGKIPTRTRKAFGSNKRSGPTMPDGPSKRAVGPVGPAGPARPQVGVTMPPQVGVTMPPKQVGVAMPPQVGVTMPPKQVGVAMPPQVGVTMPPKQVGVAMPPQVGVTMPPKQVGVAMPPQVGVAMPPQVGVAMPPKEVGVAMPPQVGVAMPPKQVGVAMPPQVGVAMPPQVGVAMPPKEVGVAMPPQVGVAMPPQVSVASPPRASEASPSQVSVASPPQVGVASPSKVRVASPPQVGVAMPPGM